jgi:hypothetical protein
MIDSVIFEPIPDYGEHMTIQEFNACCLSGAFTDDDGLACYATKTQMTDIKVCPSDFEFTSINNHPYTHIVWFNA